MPAFQFIWGHLPFVLLHHKVGACTSLFAGHHRIAASRSFYFSGSASVYITPLGWCRYIILIWLPGQHLYCTTVLAQLHHFYFELLGQHMFYTTGLVQSLLFYFGLPGQAMKRRGGGVGAIVSFYFAVAGSAFVLHHWVGAIILSYLRLLGQRLFCTTGLVLLIHLVWALGPWCVPRHRIGTITSVYVWPPGQLSPLNFVILPSILSSVPIKILAYWVLRGT